MYPFRMAYYFPFLILSDTLAAGVLLTNCLPFAPAAFFFLAVAARCDLLKEFILLLGRHLSGFFLFLEVPQGPPSLPSDLTLLQFCALHLANSPILFLFLYR